MRRNQLLRFTQFFIALALALQCHVALGFQSEQLPAGSRLPRLILPAPDSVQVQKYLGLPTMEPFAMSRINARMLIVEFMSVLCPHCQANAPVMNKLYKVIQDNPALAGDIKIIAIAIGSSKNQVDAFRKKFKVPFPMFPDEGYAVVGDLESLDTPTTVLTTITGKVLTSHLGEIRDFDAFLKEIRQIHKKTVGERG